jgi:hypothetical protein
MNSAKRAFVAGFLLVLLAGCFNPITATDPNPPRQQDDGPAPFTVDILIGEDTAEARFLAGSSSEQLGGLYNFMELVVVKDGTATVFTRAESDTSKGMSFSLGNLSTKETYHFLLLMGHKAAGGAPTLLAAGLQSQAIDKTGKVTITMWPIEVETDFIHPTGGLAVEKADGVTTASQPASLPGAGKWTVRWTLGGRAGKAVAALQTARKKASGGEDPAFDAAEVKIIPAEGDAETVAGAAVAGNVVTAPLGDLDKGAAGAVFFNLTYQAFNLSSDTSLTAWIIRNGVNDDAQDEQTDFSNPAAWTAGANGNGAVNFTVVQAAAGGGINGLGDPLLLGDAPFSNATGNGDASIIDMIRAAKNEIYVNIAVNDTGTAEKVEFIADTDFGTTGWVLEAAVSSPVLVSIDGGGRVIGLTGSPSGKPLITVKAGVMLMLTNIIFEGMTNNTAPVIKVDGGSLIIENVVIKNNTAVIPAGGGGGDGGDNGSGPRGAGGVFVTGGGMFTMQGSAVISGNSCKGGQYSAGGYGVGGGAAGGVLVEGSSMFTMQDNAVIMGNTGEGGTGTGNWANACSAGGVYVGGGTFTMKSAAAINNNTGVLNTSRGKGSRAAGGVFVGTGTFTLESGAIISGNTGSESQYNGVYGTYTNEGNTPVSAVTPAPHVPSPWIPARLQAVMAAALPAAGSGGVYRKKSRPAGIPA